MEETGSLREESSVVGAQQSRTVVGEKLEIMRILEDSDLCKDDECPWIEEERKVKQGLKGHKGG